MTCATRRSFTKLLCCSSSPRYQTSSGGRGPRFVGNVGGLFLGEADRNKKDLIEETLENDKNIIQIIKSESNGFPDFFIILKKNYVFTTKASFFVKIKGVRNIYHDQYGLFIAYGKEIKSGFKNQVDYVNIAPTIMLLNPLTAVLAQTGSQFWF